MYLKAFSHFAKKINQLLENNDLRSKMGEAGYKKVKKKFDQEKMVKDMEKAYLELLKK